MKRIIFSLLALFSCAAMNACSHRHLVNGDCNVPECGCDDTCGCSSKCACQCNPESS